MLASVVTRHRDFAVSARNIFWAFAGIAGFSWGACSETARVFFAYGGDWGGFGFLGNNFIATSEVSVEVVALYVFWARSSFTKILNITVLP